MGNPVHVTDSIVIDDEELNFKALTASGPGGQHVNKNQTAVQLRFDIIQSPSLPYTVQQRLIQLGGSRVNNDYQLVITARRHRSQARNKREVIERLCELICKAAERRKPRLKRKRSFAENNDRLEQKRRNSERKAQRRKVHPGQE
ncbi:MAG: alternative ribosome rescue aminoacyl-tRNA hydrolase ArfB [Gammaproteobacteria bacterium]